MIFSDITQPGTFVINVTDGLRIFAGNQLRHAQNEAVTFLKTCCVLISGSADILTSTRPRQKFGVSDLSQLQLAGFIYIRTTFDSGDHWAHSHPLGVTDLRTAQEA